MKWTLALICLGVVCDLTLGDPLSLRHPDFNAIRQDVRNFGYHLSRGEYGEMLRADLPGKKR